MLAELPIDIQPPIALDQVERVLSLGERLGLSAYDASYIDLCLVTGSRLATLDRRLADAARLAGANVIEAI